LQIISVEAANDLLKSHQFDLFSETLNQDESVLFYTENVQLQHNAQVSHLIPIGTEPIFCIVVEGDLAVQGTLLNTVDGVGAKERGVNLLVLGSLTAQNLISTNATIFVQHDLNLEGAAYLYYDNGTSELRVDGTFNAQGLIVNDEHRTRFEHFNAMHDLDLYNADFEEIAVVLRADLLLNDEEEINHDALVQALENGESVFLSN
jgi:hypothetical protein